VRVTTVFPGRTATGMQRELLRIYRQARGWTVAEAARQTHVSRRMIGMLEAAQRRPSESTAEALIGAYRMTDQHADDVRAIAVPYVGRDSPYRTGVTPGPWQPRETPPAAGPMEVSPPGGNVN
jgi:DNA-binding XRE family transcriptional regulator